MPQLGTPINPVAASLEFASELIMPGGSNLLKGNYVQAGVHLILGIAAKAVFGVPVMALVSANSLTKALTGHHLVEHIEMSGRLPAPPIAPQPAQTSSESAPAASKARVASKKSGSKK
jgi:hypothetical protein